jgi:mRNA interferase MazF
VIAEVAEPHGGEIRKRRPFVVVSPDEINHVRETYVAVPLTLGQHPYMFRVRYELNGRRGHVVLDQLYTFDVDEIRSPVARLSPSTMRNVLATLREMFEE